jgi:pyridoxamine 5'-phosphate oxidase
VERHERAIAIYNEIRDLPYSTNSASDTAGLDAPRHAHEGRDGSLGSMGSETASMFRGIPSLTGQPPGADLSRLPSDPVPLFYEWLNTAIEAGVNEPAAISLATVDADGLPDARTLILKDVDARGWAFAGAASSRKGQQLLACPAAALNVWWQPLMRAVRVRGTVVEASREDCAADFAARSESARAGVAPDEWRLWRLQAVRVEFWEGSDDRNHLRVIYSLHDRRWNVSTNRSTGASTP